MAHSRPVHDCREAEKRVHARLSGSREAHRREFFRIATKEGIAAIDDVCDELDREIDAADEARAARHADEDVLRAAGVLVDAFVSRHRTRPSSWLVAAYAGTNSQDRREWKAALAETRTTGVVGPPPPQAESGDRILLFDRQDPTLILADGAVVSVRPGVPDQMRHLGPSGWSLILEKPSLILRRDAEFVQTATLLVADLRVDIEDDRIRTDPAYDPGDDADRVWSDVWVPLTKESHEQLIARAEWAMQVAEWERAEAKRQWFEPRRKRPLPPPPN